MPKKQYKQPGFTLIEIAIVLLIVSILLGYTVALFPKRQEIKRYRAAEQEMNDVIAAILGFAQVNGRLPCPAIPLSVGIEDGGGTVDCNNYGGFVPVNTLGLEGSINADSLLLDPWGNPYRYYVTNNDINGIGGSDFVRAGEMRAVGLVDIDVDGYIDLDGRYLICDITGAIAADNQCTGAVEVLGRYNAGPPVVYAGAPFVLVSHGKNGADAAAGDELENMGATLSNALPTVMDNGPSATPYRLKNVAAGQTTFVRRPTGFADDFDDIVKWVSPNILFSKMIEAGQLP
jgi:prepilin-type N-terminal cleavage/methylation domain-containing protein